MTGSSSCTDASRLLCSTSWSIKRNRCAIGYYQSASGQSSCYLADLGFYVNQSGQTSQNQCPALTSTIVEGSTSSLECLPDRDGDLMVDLLDDDDDNDGVLDVDDDLPLDASESLDTDGDGIGDNADADDDGDGVIDAEDIFPLDASEQVDSDNDGTGDNADSDDDGDGVEDAVDLFPLDSTESVDLDGDGIGNNADRDDDGDGWFDVIDEFPLDATEWEDANGDGLGDNKQPLSTFESVQQEPMLPGVSLAIVFGIMIMLYRAKPNSKE